jgi:hypothetical protein
MFKDNRSARACSDTFVLATLLTERGGIENNFLNPSLPQREEIVDMPANLLGFGAVPFKPRSQPFIALPV